MSGSRFMIHSSVVSAAFGTPYFTANGIRNSRDQNTTACGWCASTTLLSQAEGPRCRAGVLQMEYKAITASVLPPRQPLVLPQAL